jgi:hypothetical protein
MLYFFDTYQIIIDLTFAIRREQFPCVREHDHVYVKIDPDKSSLKLMKAKDVSRQSAEIAKRYEPTPDERAAADAVYARRIKTPRVKVSEAKGRIEIALDHPNVNFAYAQLMRAFGTGEVDFSVEILSQLAGISVRDGKMNERHLNFMFDVVKGIQPKDQLETMLAVQMAAIHSLTMTFVRRLGNVENIPQQDSAERALNKLAVPSPLKWKLSSDIGVTGSKR